MTDRFEVIEKYTNNWTRINSNTLVLWFSGYNPQVMYDCESELLTHNCMALSSEFDKVCGKTALTVRERTKNV